MSELAAGCTMMITARAPLARVAALTASACCVQRNQLAGSPNTESLQASASRALETFHCQGSNEVSCHTPRQE